MFMMKDAKSPTSANEREFVDRLLKQLLHYRHANIIVKLKKLKEAVLKIYLHSYI